MCSRPPWFWIIKLWIDSFLMDRAQLKTLQTFWCLGNSLVRGQCPTKRRMLTYFAWWLDASDECCSNKQGAQQQTEGQVPNHCSCFIQTAGPPQSHATEEERHLTVKPQLGQRVHLCLFVLSVCFLLPVPLTQALHWIAQVVGRRTSAVFLSPVCY